jgi:hypothetical protein
LQIRDDPPFSARSDGYEPACYLWQLMPNSQYGNLLFIESFASGGSTKSLQRISLEKNTAGNAP